MNMYFGQVESTDNPRYICTNSMAIECTAEMNDFDCGATCTQGCANTCNATCVASCIDVCHSGSQNNTCFIIACLFYCSGSCGSGCANNCNISCRNASSY